MWGYSWDGSTPGYVATVEDRRVSVVVGCSVAPRSSQVHDILYYHIEGGGGGMLLCRKLSLC